MSKRCQRISCWGALFALFLLVSCQMDMRELCEDHAHATNVQVTLEMKLSPDMSFDWISDWVYDWDEKDDSIWGGIGYTKPTSYQVRHYYIGKEPNLPHTDVEAFSTNDTCFNRAFTTGYHDLLIWSDIDSKDGSQVLVINESKDSVTATTTGTRGMSRSVFKLVGTRELVEEDDVVGLKNQPEIFYSSYSENIYISGDKNDYEYNADKNTYTMTIHAPMRPMVYIYLVQIVLLNNDGRVKGTNGNTAISAMASGTNLNTGHTNNIPSIVYFNTRLKRDIEFEGEKCEVIGGKFTTFGLCDMEPFTRSGSIYSGSRGDLANYLLFDLVFNNNGVKTYSVEVTDQCQSQAHGGLITVYVDCSKLELPEEGADSGTGSLFLPTVEDYQDVIWEVEL